MSLPVLWVGLWPIRPVERGRRDVVWLPVPGQKGHLVLLTQGSQLHVRRSNHPEAAMLEGRARVLRSCTHGSGPSGCNHVRPQAGAAEPFPNSWPTEQFLTHKTIKLWLFHISSLRVTYYTAMLTGTIIHHFTSEEIEPHKTSGTCPKSHNFKVAIFFFLPDLF